MSKSNEDFVVGNPIEFRLDGKVEGKGIIESFIADGVLAVELTQPCKEFPVGEIIVVDTEEVVC